MWNCKHRKLARKPIVVIMLNACNGSGTNTHMGIANDWNWLRAGIVRMVHLYLERQRTPSMAMPTGLFPTILHLTSPLRAGFLLPSIRSYI